MTLQPLALGPWKGIYQSEGCDRAISKDTLTLDQSQSFGPGRILGKVTAEGGTYTVAAAVAKAGNTGNGTVALTGNGVGAGIKVGTYKVRFLAATHAEVIRPDGSVAAAEVDTGVAYVDQLKFQITAGGTAFVAGDEFSFAVTEVDAANAGRVKAWDPAATDGSEVAFAVSYEGHVTGAGETKDIVAHVRECRVWKKFLDFGSANDAQIATAIAQLAQSNLIVA